MNSYMFRTFNFNWSPEVKMIKTIWDHCHGNTLESSWRTIAKKIWWEKGFQDFNFNVARQLHVLQTAIKVIFAFGQITISVLSTYHQNHHDSGMELFHRKPKLFPRETDTSSQVGTYMFLTTDDDLLWSFWSNCYDYSSGTWGLLRTSRTTCPSSPLPGSCVRSFQMQIQIQMQRQSQIQIQMQRQSQIQIKIIIISYFFSGKIGNPHEAEGIELDEVFIIQQVE